MLDDYSLTGPRGARAVESGLASGRWYHPKVPRDAMRALMARRDGPAIRDTVLWTALLIATATGGVLTWGTWWTVPFWAAYGVLYGSACDSRWHECGHGTAFATKWMNQAVYHLASFMVMRNPVQWRFSHARHHVSTLIAGRDPEIAIMRPPAVARLLSNWLGLADAYGSMKALLRQSTGRLSSDERDYVPEPQRPAMVRAARVHVAIYAATLAAATALGSWIPLMLIGLPRLYGCWHMVMTGYLQHGGLAEDVLDHRLNTRSVLMNPVSRWIYWNMNYHVEHHMFPSVPYHALPRLHALVKGDLPAPSPSIAAAYRELLGSLRRQRTDPLFVPHRPLPAGAAPYRADLHAGALGDGARSPVASPVPAE